jgi:RNA polymerase sigma-70 factor (ECF subfamily)
MRNERLESAVLRTRGGDLDAFADVVDETIISLRAHISFYLANWSIVDDVLQETYFRLFRELNSYEPGTDFTAWAKSIAKYEALTERKRRQRQQTAKDRCLALIAKRVTDEMERGEDSSLLEKKLAALRACLKKLGEKGRALMEKRYLKGMSLAEAARACACKASSAAVMIHRSRAALAACVQKTLAAAGDSDA